MNVTEHTLDLHLICCSQCLIFNHAFMDWDHILNLPTNDVSLIEHLLEHGTLWFDQGQSVVHWGSEPGPLPPSAGTVPGNVWLPWSTRRLVQALLLPLGDGRWEVALDPPHCPSGQVQHKLFQHPTGIKFLQYHVTQPATTSCKHYKNAGHRQRVGWLPPNVSICKHQSCFPDLGWPMVELLA